MFKIMDDGLCADKDLPDMESVEESIFSMLDSCTISTLPLTIIIKEQETGERVETRTYSLKLETKHD